MAKILNNIIKYSIYSLVFLLPLFFLPLSFEAFEFNKQYLLFFLVSLGFFSWLAKMILVDKELRFKRTPLDIFVLLFLLIAILSAVFSVDGVLSLFGFYGRFSDGLVGLLSLGLLYFLIINNISLGGTKNESDLVPQISASKITKFFLLSVFIIICFSYFSIFGVFGRINNLLPGESFLPQVLLQRTFNPTAGSMESLAVFLSVILVFIIGRIIIRKEKGGLADYLFLLAIFVLMILIDFNASWWIVAFSLIAILAVFLWKRIFKEDVNKLLLPIIIIVLASTFLMVDTSRIQSVFGFGLLKEPVLSQSVTWQVGFKGATESIKSGFFGSGIGTFSYDFAKFKPKTFNENNYWRIRFDRGSSHFAEVLGTMGFIGLFSWLAMIGFFLMAGYFLLQKDRLGIPLLMAFVALVVAQFFFYQNSVLSFTFWLVLALSIVRWQSLTQDLKVKVISFKNFPELSLVFSAVLIVLGLSILILYFFSAKFYLADINSAKAFNQDRTARLEKAITLNPYQPQYKILLSRDYLSKILNEISKPADQWNEVIFANVTDRAINYSKGGQIIIYSNDGQIEQGPLVKGAVEISPNRVVAWETLGMVYREIQAIPDALGKSINAFEKALELEPTNPVLHTEIAKLYSTLGDTERAIEEFKKAQDLKLDYTESSIRLALLYEALGNMDEAVYEMEKLAESYPSNVDGLFQLGRLYFDSNRTEEAILVLRRVVDLAPFYANAHYYLGIAYQKIGQNQMAIGEFEIILELSPGNADVQEKLNALRGTGQ
ncbi:MAG: tetratricopeptide repeat protein [Candidatus Nealsonbacteria bacterium]